MSRELVVDASALVAVAFEETGHEWIEERLRAARQRVMSAPTRVEFGIVMEGRLPAEGRGAIELVLVRAKVEVVPFDDTLAALALAGWRRFGKGRHPAALNLGDTYSYALARQLGWPLLCTGNDFARTDVEVLAPPT